MNWNISVPSILHVYWGGTALVYMSYLTVYTFMKLNPDWQVIVWYPEKPYKGKSWGNTGREMIDPRRCKDYFPDLLNLPVTKMPVNFSELGFSDNIAEVHKADYIRIHSLALYGGVWSDMDIMYFKPITELKVNVPANKDKETYVCIGPYGHSTGFNMATEGSKFFNSLTEKINREYKSSNYQCWGPDLFNKYYRTLDLIPNAVNIGMEAVYAHNCHQVSELLNGGKARFNGYSIGCHWYAGNSLWGSFFNNTNGGQRNLQNNIISSLINAV